MSALLSLRDITITFGGIRAVEGVSFDVQPESIVSLVGPNGAGKTTVLNGISGFVRAQGSILYDGQTELLSLPAHRRSAVGIGRTFQNLQLFRSMTLAENVMAGQHSMLRGNLLYDMLRFPVASDELQARRRAHGLLHTLGIEQYSDRRADSLPLGVQKLAGVARALAAKPRLVLLDEPAAGLNYQESTALASLITVLRHELGIAILLVEHNMRMVMSVSDSIVVLVSGRKLTEGTPPEVANNPEVIAAYLGTEAQSSPPVEVGHGLADRS